MMRAQKTKTIFSEIRYCSFTLLVISLHLAVWGIISLSNMGVNVPIVRQVICFIYLTFLPGLIILRLFGFRKIGIMETMLYSIGLSLFFIMIVGLISNSLYPLIGIRRPISLVPLIITFSIINLLLCSLCHMKDGKDDLFGIYFRHFSFLLSRNALFIYVGLFISIFGIYLVNFHSSNTLLLFLIPFDTLILLLITYNFIDNKYYIPAIFIISLSLLFQSSLFSIYITGADIHVEYYFANLVKQSGIWDYFFQNNVNSTLSTTMLASIYSIVCDMDLTWVLKIIYPFLFSLVPIGLYIIYREQLDNKLAFLSVFYFIAVNPFYLEMLSLPRQQIAEFFFVLIILVFHARIDLVKKRFLLIVFTIGLVTSHYGLTYLFLIFCLIGIPFMKYILKTSSDLYKLSYGLFLLVAAISWYLYISGGSSLDNIIRLSYQLTNIVQEDVLNTYSTNLITRKSISFSGTVLKIMYLISQLLIGIGFSRILLQSRVPKLKTIYRFSSEYISLSFVCFLALAVSAVTSNTGMNIHRLYHIAIIVLAPFCVIGGISLFEMLSKIVTRIIQKRVVCEGHRKIPRESNGICINSSRLPADPDGSVFQHRTYMTKKSNDNPLKSLSIFLVIFFLLDTGWFQEIVNDPARSLSLGSQRIKNSNDNDVLTNFYSFYFPETDIYCIEWLSDRRNNMFRIYADLASKTLPMRSYGMISESNALIYILDNNSRIENDSYIYLGYSNLQYDLINGPKLFAQYWDVLFIMPELDACNIIYSNGYSNIYYR